MQSTNAPPTPTITHIATKKAERAVIQNWHIPPIYVFLPVRQPAVFSPQATHQSVCLLSLAVAAKHVHDLVLIQVDHVFTSLATVLAWVEILRMQSKCLAHTSSKCQT